MMYNKHSMKKRNMKGRGIGSFLRKVNNFLKRTKLISRLGSVGSAVGVPYVGAVGKVAGSVGYGRRCRKYCRRGRPTRHRRKMGGGIGLPGGGLSLPGGSLKLAGQGRKRRSGRVLTYNAPNMKLSSARAMY